MAVSPALSIAGVGAGTRFSGEFKLLGRVETRLSQKPRKHSGCLCFYRHQLRQYYKCFWQEFRTEKLSLKESLALRKDHDDSFLSNVEDTDEMFDDLFNKYGKVVFRSNDKKPPTAEVDDDAESLSYQFCSALFTSAADKYFDMDNHVSTTFENFSSSWCLSVLFGTLVFFVLALFVNDSPCPASFLVVVAVEMAKVASDVKASDIKVLFVKPLVYWTRFFIIATAFSRPQIDAINSKIRDLAEKKYGKVPSGDRKPNSWTLLDFGDVVIHIFLPPQRDFYNLEEFYGNATPIELPFENQRPFSS
ncbi:hypothetical protein POTOM_006951 [Populus tomentosa]|uniref:Protein Iojap, chloroplastic n=1 Tax=Populus tomentosa TaxID=118781 RepID=A0A8X8ALX7_POPTO|nr:hypothetical protein POTOM_006951 [Populus tomentosa]